MITGACGCSTAARADRWVRRLHPKAPAFGAMADWDDGLAQVIETPDLDGDGTRDLVAVSRFDGRRFVESASIYVDAVSGKDGHGLWQWHSDFTVGHWRPSVTIWPPFLWGRKDSGSPRLAVPLGGAEPTWIGQAHPDPHQEPPRVHFLAVTNGSELHTIDGLSWPKPADLDGDGLTDLWGSVNGNLVAYRGQTTEAWRVLGRHHSAADLDGDAIADVISDDLRVRPSIDVNSRKTLMAAAHSGRDGRVLWRAMLEYQGPWLEVMAESEPGYTLSTFARPGGDLDGDGVPEISAIRSGAYYSSLRGVATLPLEVLSGRSGRLFWSAGPLPLGFNVTTSYPRSRSIDLRACEPRGPMDIIVRHQGQYCSPAHQPAEWFFGRIAWPAFPDATAM